MTHRFLKLRLTLLVTLTLSTPFAPAFGAGAAAAADASAVAAPCGYRPLAELLPDDDPLRGRLIDISSPMSPEPGGRYSVETWSNIKFLADQLSSVTDFAVKETFLVCPPPEASCPAGGGASGAADRPLLLHSPGRGISQIGSTRSIICEGVNPAFYRAGFMGKGFYMSPNANKCLAYATFRRGLQLFYRPVAYLLAIEADLGNVYQLDPWARREDTTSGPPDGYHSVTGAPSGGREYMVADPGRLRVVALFCLASKKSPLPLSSFYQGVSSCGLLEDGAIAPPCSAVNWVQKASEIVRAGDMGRLVRYVRWLEARIPCPLSFDDRYGPLRETQVSKKALEWLHKANVIKNGLIGTVSRLKSRKPRKEQKRKLEEACRLASYELPRAIRRSASRDCKSELNDPVSVAHMYHTELGSIRLYCDVLTKDPDRNEFAELREVQRTALEEVQRIGGAALARIESLLVELGRYKIAVTGALSRQDPDVVSPSDREQLAKFLIEPRLFDWRVWFFQQPGKLAHKAKDAPLNYAEACESRFRERLECGYALISDIRQLGGSFFSKGIHEDLARIDGQLLELSIHDPIPVQVGLVDAIPLDDSGIDPALMDPEYSLFDDGDLGIEDVLFPGTEAAAAASIALPGPGVVDGSRHDGAEQRRKRIRAVPDGTKP